MTKKINYVYIVYEDRLLSCDRDYDEDGFVIVWDCDEIGRNLTTCQLIEAVGQIDNDIYQAVINYLFRELELDYGESSEDLNYQYFEEVFEFLQEEIGGGVFYRYYYQAVPFVKEICADEEYAKKRVEYYTNNQYYKNKHYYVKHRLLENEGW